MRLARNRQLQCLLLLAWLWVTLAWCTLANDISGTVVDGLNRPLSGATVALFRIIKDQGVGKETPISSVLTDQQGQFVVRMAAPETNLWQRVSKPGYMGFFRNPEGLVNHVSYTLRRDFRTLDVANLREQFGPSLNAIVFDILAAEDDSITGAEKRYDLLFHHGNHVRQALLVATNVSVIKEDAIQVLGLIGSQPKTPLVTAWENSAFIEQFKLARDMDDRLLALALFFTEGNRQRKSTFDEKKWNDAKNSLLVRCGVGRGGLYGSARYRVSIVSESGKWVVKAIQRYIEF